jgi:type I restriction enzyme, S subunit
MSLAKYPKYTASGTVWLGEIPHSWRTTPLRTLFRRVKRIGHEGEQLLSVYRDYGVIPKSSRNDNNNKASDDLSLYQLVQPGDLAVNKMKAWQGSVAISEHRGIASPAYFIYKPVHEENSRYLHYLFRSVRYIAGYLSISKGIRVNQWDLEPQYHSCMAVVLPNFSEQVAIAAFLDHETCKIDALIAEQEKLIALLVEKRQTMIAHLVTHGRDPDVPTKESGVVWLNHIPSHWVLTPLSRIAKERCDGPFGSGIKSEHYTNDGALVVRLQNIRAGTFSKGDSVFVDERYFFSDLQGHSVAAGDLLIAGLGDDNNLLGRACVAPAGLGPALVKADCFRFRLDQTRAVPDFVAWQLSAGASHDAGILATGTTRSRIPLSIMASRKIALPPLEEQAAIANVIAVENKRVDALKSEADRAIDLLKERRSALISAAVTGQIDIRDAAPRPVAREELTV